MIGPLRKASVSQILAKRRCFRDVKSDILCIWPTAARESIGSPANGVPVLGYPILKRLAAPTTAGVAAYPCSSNRIFVLDRSPSVKIEGAMPFLRVYLLRSGPTDRRPASLSALKWSETSSQSPSECFMRY